MKLYGGIDLYSNNSVVALLDEEDRMVYRNRLCSLLEDRPQLMLWNGSEQFAIGDGSPIGAPDSQPRDGADPMDPAASD